MTSSNIDFVYQNKIIKIKNPDSNETLLNYVRTKLSNVSLGSGLRISTTFSEWINLIMFEDISCLYK